MKSFVLEGAVAAALLSMTGIAAAQTTAMATADLNIRSGPGPQYPAIGVLRTSEQATVNGCMPGSNWCSVVSSTGIQGWAYAAYLVTGVNGGSTVVVTQLPSGMVPTITYEGSGAVVGGPTGPVTGAIVGGPPAAIETIAPPPPNVVQYMETNPVEPLQLEGRVAVGETLPPTVMVHEIPDYEYRYVYINGEPVLVEPQSRRIVYVMP